MCCFIYPLFFVTIASFVHLTFFARLPSCVILSAAITLTFFFDVFPLLTVWALVVVFHVPFSYVTQVLSSLFSIVSQGLEPVSSPFLIPSLFISDVGWCLRQARPLLSRFIHRFCVILTKSLSFTFRFHPSFYFLCGIGWFLKIKLVLTGLVLWFLPMFLGYSWIKSRQSTKLFLHLFLTNC